MLKTISDFAPEGVEAGVGLALQDAGGRYLFFLAGTRHRCPPGTIFYAGIGGHREAGEEVWKIIEPGRPALQCQFPPLSWHN